MGIELTPQLTLINSSDKQLGHALWSVSFVFSCHLSAVFIILVDERRYHCLYVYSTVIMRYAGKTLA